jgi:hypothetical protein
LFVRQRWLLRRFFCGMYYVANNLIELFDVRGIQTRFSRVMIPVRIVLRGKLAPRCSRCNQLLRRSASGCQILKI